MGRERKPQVVSSQSELVSISDLKRHPRNPRQGDVGAIIESVERNGFYGTLVVQRSTGFVLAGNHRLQAAAQLGIDQVPVVYVDVDDETALRILVADNRTNDLASYDDDQLAALLKDLAAGGGLEGTGYDGDDLDQLLGDLDRDPLPAPAGGEPGFDEQYGVIVVCDDEASQAAVYEKLAAEYENVRVVTT